MDFEKMAREAKARSDRRVAEATETRERERQEIEARRQAAVAKLTAEVLPTLERAKQAFARIGVELIIEDNFELTRPSRTSPMAYKVQCLGPEVAPQGSGTNRPKGHFGEFSCRAGDIYVRSGNPLLGTPRPVGVHFTEAVAETLQTCLDTCMLATEARRS